MLEPSSEVFFSVFRSTTIGVFSEILNHSSLGKLLTGTLAMPVSTLTLPKLTSE